MASNWIGRAKNGEPPVPAADRIRMVAANECRPLFFITALRPTSVQSPTCAGKRVVVGMKTSGMVQHAHNIFPVLGMSFSDFTPVYLDFIAGADALARGRADAQFQCPIPNKVMTDLAQRTNVRVLPMRRAISPPEQAVSYYRPVVMRKGGAPRA